MKVHRDIAKLSQLEGPVHLSIGVFDGVHLGHQSVIRSAHVGEGTPVVVTFDPHPAQLFRPQAAPLRLTTPRHQELVLRRLGVDHLLVIPFTEEFARTEAVAFVQNLVRACHPLGTISVGRDWVFGHQRKGNVELLRSLGVDVRAVEPVAVGQEVASSTLIREAVAAGDFGRAATFLGRPWTILGTVTPGRRLARTLDLPTANLPVSSIQLPPFGVYTARAQVRGELRHGVANLGIRPTIESGPPAVVLEVHFFDFEGDLYGRELDVELVTHLRPEKKFSGFEELSAQIRADAAQARELTGRLRVTDPEDEDSDGPLPG